MNTETDQILADAADYVATHGHHKGSFYAYTSADAPQPSACALGSLRMTSGLDTVERSLDSEEFRAAYEAAYRAYQAAATRLANHLRAQGLLPFPNHDVSTSFIPAWNDAEERTAEEVVLALKRAAHDG